MPWVRLQFVNVAFPYHTNLLFFTRFKTLLLFEKMLYLNEMCMPINLMSTASESVYFIPPFSERVL